MRKLLPLFLLSVCCSASAEWTKYAVTNSGDELFINFQTIKIRGNSISVWVLINDATDGTSTKGYHEHDCKNDRFRVVQFIGFSGHFGKGKIIFNGSLNESEPWRQIDPESNVMVAHRIICKI